MEDFKTIKNFIEANLRFGDVRKITERAGISQPMFSSAMRKNDWDSLTKCEQAIIKNAVRFIKARANKEKKDIAKMTESI